MRLQFVDRFEAGAAILFVLRNGMFVTEDTDHIRFRLLRKFQHGVELVSDERFQFLFRPGRQVGMLYASDKEREEGTLFRSPSGKTSGGEKNSEHIFFSQEGTRPPNASKRNPPVSRNPTLACTTGA